MLLWEIIDNAAESVADREALVDGDRRWTFSELAELVRDLADTLSGFIEPGDRVAIVSENSAEYVAALYGVPRAGGVLVHGNTRHTTDELASMVARSGSSVLLASGDQLARLETTSLPSVGHRLELRSTAARAAPVVAGTQLRDTRAVHAGSDPGPGPERSLRVPSPRSPTGGDGLAWLMYTSGTTGAPKGVMLTHRSLISAALNTTMCRPIAPDEVYLFAFPLFHVAAYNVVHLHLRNRPVVLLPRFEPGEVLRLIGHERITSVSLAPTMLAMLLDHPDRDGFELSTLRSVSYGAAPMPLELLRRSLEVWPEVGLAQGYGMTELSGNAVFLSPDDHRRAASTDPDLLTAAGRPAPMTSLRIVDEAGIELPRGHSGEITISGDQVCAGYFDDPEATDDGIRDGWLHTGDLGRVDAQGYLHVVDRLKDIIITGGENVSSRELEDVLGTHPDVRAVSVIGTPDERWGELVTAVVVPEEPQSPPTLEELRATCSQLAGFKHPRRVVLVEELPTNASGKVDKVALRSLV